MWCLGSFFFTDDRNFHFFPQLIEPIHQRFYREFAYTTLKKIGDPRLVDPKFFACFLLCPAMFFDRFLYG
jgi:hypothetical protein